MKQSKEQELIILEDLIADLYTAGDSDCVAIRVNADGAGCCFYMIPGTLRKVRIMSCVSLTIDGRPLQCCMLQNSDFSLQLMTLWLKCDEKLAM